MKITSAHGSGGKMTGDLIREIFEKHFSNEILSEMQDAAVLTVPSRRIAFTTDSFVVTPLFFSGGDIGRLSVCGTANDLLMRGAIPRYLSAGFILEEGLDTEVLDRVVESMSRAAREAGVAVVAGDTKVIEGKGGLYINTAGIGVFDRDVNIGAQCTRDGDAILISGFLGDHEACILSSRMGIENDIESDCAPLGDMVMNLLNAGIEVHTLRDITRGGLATVLHEIASASRVHLELSGDCEYASPQVRGLCDILGLDPLTMGNEGKLVCTVPGPQTAKALSLIKASRYGANVQFIGTAVADGTRDVTITTRSGATRPVEPLLGEGLPRIC